MPSPVLLNLLYHGGLSATYYFGANMYVSCQSETWTYEVGDNPSCSLGPWGTSAASVPDFSFASAAAPTFLNAGVVSTAWNARWKGFIKPSAAATYTFTVTVATNNNVGSVYFFGSSVATVSSTSGAVTATVAFATAEALYDIDITFSTTVPAQTNSMQLLWSRGGGAGTGTAIPTNRLFPLVGRYRVDYTPVCSWRLFR